jgi:hypothetical protein
MKLRAVTRLVVATLVSAALVVVGTTTAQAAAPATPKVVASSSSPATATIPIEALTSQGYTLEEIKAAIANSPYVTLGTAPVVTGTKGITPMGVTLGTVIYIRVSQATAKALMVADVATCIAILGLATGGIGLIIATAVFSFMGSINDSYLNRCANWEFHATYPLPWSPSKIVYAECYYP